MMEQSLAINEARRVRPNIVANYLRLHGWTQFDVLPGKATFWRTQRDTTGDEYEVLLPTDPQLKDFSARMLDLVRTIAACEGRNLDAVFATLITPADTMRVQIKRDDALDGTISLADGVSAFQGVKELFHAAAASLEEPRAFYSTRSKGEVTKFLKDARLGQTQRGSYVIAVYARLPSTLPLFGEPFERRVLRQLVSGVEAAKDAANVGTEQAFKSRVESGVSANLCFALAKLGRGREFREVTLSVDWSWFQPVGTTATRQTISLSSSTVETIRAGGELLKHVEPDGNFILVGRVVRLEREGEAEGTIAIEGQIDHKVRRVTVVLQGHDHSLAIKAYATQELVRCVGSLTRNGSNYVLIGARKFGFVLPDAEPEPEPEPA